MMQDFLFYTSPLRCTFSALFALEYNNHPEYAAQAVLLSSLLSGFSVTIAVYLSKIMF